MSVLARANRRYFLRHPLQLLLAIVGVAMGVAMLVSIDLAASSTHRAFALSMQALTGRYAHHIRGGPEGLPEALFARLRREAGLRQSAPALEGYVEARGQTLRLVGFDPMAERDLRSRFVAAARGDTGLRLLTDIDTALLSKATAQRLSIQPGTRLDIEVNGAPRSLLLLDYIEGDAPPDPVLEGILLADISTAQEVLGRIGRLDRIDLILADDPGESERIRGFLPPGLTLEAVAGRHSATQNMTAAFELNLRAMSLLALLVGGFLIYNTMAFSVLQRRELLAALRVLGATRRQLLLEILLEAGLIGLVGGLLGLGLGVVAAQGLLHGVTRTINDLYFVLTVTEFMLDPLILVYGLSLGVAAAVVAALGPALEAAWAPPIASRARSGLESVTRKAIPWLALVGALTVLLAGGVLESTQGSLVAAIAAVFCLLLGYGLMCPLLLLVCAAGIGRCAASGKAWLLRLAVRSVAAAVSRAGLAIAALTVSVAVSVGVGAMIDSFRGTIAEWLDQILEADIYITVPTASPRASVPLPDPVVQRLGQLPGVRATISGRRSFIPTSLGESELLVLSPPAGSAPGFRFKDADSVNLWTRFPSQQAVFVSEPYAERHGLKVGESFDLQTDAGIVRLPVAGIFFDYRSDQGLILMHRTLYHRYWNDRSVTSLGLYLDHAAALPEMRALIDAALVQERVPLTIRSNREIRDISLETFNRTFAITQVLRLLSVGVALIGILSAIMALQYERRREMAVLRATGLTPLQTGLWILIQTGFMGLTAGLLSIPLGLALARVLVRVINLRSFGWTMALTIEGPPLLAAVVLAVVAALLAGLYPAYLAMRAQPAVALREE